MKVLRTALSWYLHDNTKLIPTLASQNCLQFELEAFLRLSAGQREKDVVQSHKEHTLLLWELTFSEHKGPRCRKKPPSPNAL
jgi:hypothetical protein